MNPADQYHIKPDVWPNQDKALIYDGGWKFVEPPTTHPNKSILNKLLKSRTHR